MKRKLIVKKQKINEKDFDHKKFYKLIEICNMVLIIANVLTLLTETTANS